MNNLQAARARLEARSPGEWYAWPIDNPTWPPSEPTWSFGNVATSPDDLNKADATFIAHSPTDLEAALRVVQHARDLATDGDCPFCAMDDDVHADFCPLVWWEQEAKP